MEREFVLMPIFDSQWEAMGLDDDDLKELQRIISENPHIGAVIRGTAGLRKMRIKLDNTGKSGGARVLYVDLPSKEKTYLIYSYPKNELDNITPEQRKMFKKAIIQIKKNEGENA